MREFVGDDGRQFVEREQAEQPPVEDDRAPPETAPDREGVWLADVADEEVRALDAYLVAVGRQPAV